MTTEHHFNRISVSPGYKAQGSNDKVTWVDLDPEADVTGFRYVRVMQERAGLVRAGLVTTWTSDTRPGPE